MTTTTGAEMNIPNYVETPEAKAADDYYGGTWFQDTTTGRLICIPND